MKFKRNNQFISRNNTATVSEEVAEIDLNQPEGSSQDFSRIFFAIRSLFVWLIIGLPLAFGGVHPRTTTITQIFVFSIAAIFFWFESRDFHGNKNLQEHASLKRKINMSSIVIISMAIVAGYFFLQNLFFSFLPVEHPVLAGLNRKIPWFSFIKNISPLLTFLCIFVLAINLMRSTSKGLRLIKQLILTGGVLVSAVALTHWFYDNGKLFWIFEPDYTFESIRARWPFVNANNLAHFLLPIIFIYLSISTIIRRELITLASTRSYKRSTDIIVSHHFQKLLIKLSFSLVALLTVGLAFTAALSRSSWFGFSVGLVIFVLGKWYMDSMELKDSKSQVSDKLPENSNIISYNAFANKHGAKSRRRRKREEKVNRLANFLPLLNKAIRPAIILGAIGTFVFFLQNRGLELLSGRVDYALEYSLDDIRFTMLSETLKMIRDYPLFGVGLGQWSAFYPQYMSHPLSGINPVFLHSDPFQLFAEGGLIAVAIFLIFISVLFYRSLVLLTDTTIDLAERYFILGILSGLFGLLSSSFFDFPFHINAIVTYVAIYLALISHSIDTSTASIQSA